MGAVSVYSFGPDSPIKLEIPDKMATLYNEAADQWFKTQRRFDQKFGRPWDPKTDPIKLDWTHKQKKAWANVAEVFNKVLAEKGPFHENDIMDDFLVRNVGVAVAGAALVWGRVFRGAALAGSLTELLRGL